VKAKPLAVFAVLGVVCLLIYVGTRLGPGRPHALDEGSTDDVDSRGADSGVHWPQAVSEGSSDGANFATPLAQKRLADARQSMDPQNDGWKTEVFSEAALKQLHLLEDLLEAGPPSAKELAPLIAEDFSCSPLRPDGLETVWEASSLTVRRQRAEANAASPAVFRGGAGWSEALQALREALCKDSQAKNSHPHVHFKLYRVEQRDGQVATVVDYQAAADVASSAEKTAAVQQNATWRCLWRQPAGDAPPQLASVEVDRYEEIVYSPPGGGHAMFSDCTLAAVGKNACFEQQLRPSLDHWVRRIERRHNIVLGSRYGLALGDVNGDELDDVYVCQPGALPKRLLVHNPDGTVTDLSQQAGVDWLDLVASALLVDLDNDGDQDLVLGMISRLVLMANDGRGRFTVNTLLPLEHYDVQSLCAADYDNDGYLDLLACVGKRGKGTAPSGAFSFTGTFNFHDAKDGGGHTLFRSGLGNSGRKNVSGAAQDAWQFTNVTSEVGLDKDNFRHCLAAAWEDYDDDGDQDLCIANDYGPKELFRNDGGKFVDVAAASGAQDLGSGMSVSWADYNRDGRMDLYFGNMFSSAGNRIAFQSRYMAGVDEMTRATYQRFAKGNTLLRNVGGGKFQEVENAGVELGRWAWSSLFVDVNNDGWDDVLVANGFITGDDASDL
jgi:hypothetical protein